MPPHPRTSTRAQHPTWCTEAPTHVAPGVQSAVNQKSVNLVIRMHVYILRSNARYAATYR